MLRLDHNICITSAEDIRAICQPLFESTCISFFDYDRYYPDNSWCSLCTSAELTRHYIEDGLYATYSEIQAIAENVKYTLLSSALDPIYVNDRYQQNISIAQHYQIHNRLYLPQTQAGYYEIFGFGTAGTPNELFNFYIHYGEILENFIHYFKQKARRLIDESARHRIQLVVDHIPHQTMNHHDHVDVQAIQSKLSLRQHVLTCQGRDVTISQREYQCLLGLKKAYSATRIAKDLHLSSRTIEGYIDSLKNKTGLTSKAKLVEFANENLAKILL